MKLCIYYFLPNSKTPFVHCQNWNYVNGEIREWTKQNIANIFVPVKFMKNADRNKENIAVYICCVLYIYFYYRTFQSRDLYHLLLAMVLLSHCSWNGGFVKLIGTEICFVCATSLPLWIFLQYCVFSAQVYQQIGRRVFLNTFK